MKLPPVYQSLLKSPDGAVEELLLTSLDDLDTEYALHAIDVIVERQHTPALRALVEQYEQFSAPCQQRVLDRIHHLESGLRECIQSSKAETRLNAIRMIQSGECYVMSYMLGMALHSLSETTRGRAASALLSLTTALAERMRSAERLTGPAAIAPRSQKLLSRQDSDRAHLVSALKSAIGSYDSHSRASLADAAMTMSLYLEKELFAQADRPRARFRRAILDRLKNDPQPFAAPLAMQAIASASLRPSVGRVLADCRDHKFMTAFVQQSWLLGDHKIRGKCRAIKRLDWLTEDLPRILEMSASQHRQTARLVSATGLADDQKIDFFRAAVSSEQPEKQRVALWGLIAIKSAASTDALQMSLDWADPDVARIAHREIVRRHPQDAEILRQRSEPAQASSLNTDSAPDSALADEIVEMRQYWARYDDLSNETRILLGEKLRRAGVDILGFLAIRLRGDLASDILRALQIATTLRLVDDLKQWIFECTRHDNQIVRSAAVKALAQAEGASAERILIAALDDPDRRVRANAIEALDDIGSPLRVERIKPKLRDPDSRVRSTAIKALLKLRIRDAAESLIELLRHPSRAHRMSALWVVEKLNLAGILDRIRSMTLNDPDDDVRRRAQRLFREDTSRRRRRNVPIPPPREEKQV